MKKILSIALVVAMMLSMVVVSVSADGWDGTTVSTALEGDGSAATPYLIKSAADLAFFANDVRGGNTYAGKYVKQTADIDLNENLLPIIGTDAKQFNGVYDGAGHKITNFKGKVSEYDTALFARVQSTSEFQAAVLNLTVEGTMPELTYTNATNPSIAAIVARLVGVAGKPAVVANCVADVDITIEKDFTDGSYLLYVAGVVAQGQDCQVYNCVNKGDIKVVTSGRHHLVAGIMAQSYDNIVIEGCANYGDITSDAATVGRISVGAGVAARTNNRSGAYLLKNNTNYGDIVVKSANISYASGIVAQGFNNATLDVTIDNCANVGSISSETVTEGLNAYAGGIVGYESVGNFTVKNCVASGVATATAPGKNMLPGGIVGVSNPGESQQNSSIEDCSATTKVNGWLGGKATAENCTSDADDYAVALAVYNIEKAQFAATKITLNAVDANYTAKAIAEPVAPQAPSAPSTPTGDGTMLIVLIALVSLAGAVVVKKVSVR